MHRDDIAKLCHETNRTYCQLIGDYTQPPWEQAPEWQKRSALIGVEFVINHPDAPPSASHDSWLEEKKASGWKWGPEKNADTKEHPCFLSYAELPAQQRLKDHLFTAIVRACMAV